MLFAVVGLLTVNFGVDREKTLDHLAPASCRYRCLLAYPLVVSIAVRILVRLSIVEARLIVIITIAGTLESTQHVVPLRLSMVPIMISLLNLIF